MRQLFSVGEEVILCSKNRTELNGEYTIVKVLVGGERHICRLTEKDLRLHVSAGVCYLLNEPYLDSVLDVEVCWSQRALRKKHKPSTESFSEMMRNLNTIKV